MMDEVDDIKRGPDHDFISRLITDYFSQKIFDVVCDFMVKKNDEEIIGGAVSDNGEDEEEDEGEYGYEDQNEEYYEDEGFHGNPTGVRGKKNKEQ